MKAKTRTASKAKAYAIKMALECERLAQKAGETYRHELSQEDKLAALEAQATYNQISVNWFATALRAEEISPQKFTGRKKKGPSSQTIKRVEYLKEISKTLGQVYHNDIVNEAIKPKNIKRTNALWSGTTDEICCKIINFMRNNSKHFK